MKANKRGIWTIDEDKLYRDRKKIMVEIRKLKDKRDVIDKLITDVEVEKYTVRKFIANEISQFLQDAGFEDASKAVDCEYEL